MRTRGRISVDVPENWLFKEQLTVYGAADESGHHPANLIASSEPVPAGIETEEYAKSTEEMLRKEFPAYQETQLEPIDVFGDRSGWLRRFEWEPELDQHVVQLQVYYVEDGRGYTVTATAATEDFQIVQTQLIELLGSLRLEPGGSVAPPAAAAAVSAAVGEKSA